MREFLRAMTRNTISLMGVAITTVSALVFISLFILSLLGWEAGPYSGILAFLIVPAFFVVGLLLIPVGIWRYRRWLRRTGESPDDHRFPTLDFNESRVRNVTLWIAAFTVVNVVIAATGTYKGLEVMDSTEFCGQACHSVMIPEFTTYQRSPHSRVKCTECHIGEGASWFVKSKLSGAWQVVSVAFDLYPRPIPTPVHNLRPARETCEQCHWPTRFVGERLKVITHFDEEEQTEKKTVLLLNVGGSSQGSSSGIHWHVDPKNTVRFLSDEKRQRIYDVELTTPEGIKSFKPTDEHGAPKAGEEVAWRTMDCVDCHNRPTHVYQLPEKAVDEAMRLGALDRKLPGVRREGLKAIQASYPSHEAAKTGIREALFGFYKKEHPELAEKEPKRIEEASDKLHEIYSTNVFPQMNIQWGTYRSMLGHEGGCYRCHDNEHQTQRGEKIAKKCGMCHEVLAESEEEPEILDILHP